MELTDTFKRKLVENNAEEEFQTLIDKYDIPFDMVFDHNIISDKVHNTTRYFIDGGSNSGAKDGNINLLKLDEKGNKLWEGYLTSDGPVIR